MIRMTMVRLMRVDYDGGDQGMIGMTRVVIEMIRVNMDDNDDGQGDVKR